MLHKILGLVLIAPFIAILITIRLYIAEEKEGHKQSNDEFLFNFWCSFFLVIVIESFGVGIYLLFK